MTDQELKDLVASLAIGQKETALGMLLGFSFKGVAIATEPIWDSLLNLNLNILYFLAFGILLLNLRLLFSSFTNPPTSLNETEQALETIKKKRKEGLLTQREEEVQFQRLLEKIAERIILQKKSKNEIQKMLDSQKKKE